MRLPQGFLDECKARVPISRLGERHGIAWDRTKTNARRGDFWACCPFHHERTASFHMDDRRGFYHCFGCHESGDHIRFLRETQGWGFLEAVAELAAEAGLDMPDLERPERRERRPDPARDEERRRREEETRAWAEKGQRRAERIWEEAGPDNGLLMRYLAARGVAVEALERAWGGPPPTLRLHRDLPFYDDVPGEKRKVCIYRGPAMVGRMGAGGQLAGVHMTWITAAGRAYLGRRKLPRKMRGRTAAMHGAPVILASERATGRMVVGEGIETVLAWWSHAHLAFLSGRGPKWSAEAALSRGAIAGRADRRFRTRDPVTGGWVLSGIPDMAAPGWVAPDWVDHLVILGEGSVENALAAERESWCAQRRHAWRSDGTARRCDLILPPGGWGSGKDFADVAAERAA